jgi:hypothetical protein
MNTEVLGEIRVLIEELNQTAGNNDLSRKLEIGDKLATYNWNLAEYVGEVYGQANDLEYDYKMSVIREVNKLGGGYQAKEAIAKEKFADLYKLLTEKQNLLKRLTLLHQQTNIVIEQLRQTNSFLKQEWKQQHQ